MQHREHFPRGAARKAIGLLLFGLSCFVAVTLPARAQTVATHQNLALGASIGQGYAIDLGYGKRVRDTASTETGWDLIFSVWTPDYRFPFTSTNLPQLTPDQVTAGAVPTSSKDDRLGFGLGTRYVFKPFQAGVMFDVETIHHYDFYTNGFTYQQYVLRNDVTLGGWTGTVAWDFLSPYTLTAYYGTRRGINVGIAYNIINP
jgi:hypothetical protein